jgi:hypothetical protein
VRATERTGREWGENTGRRDAPQHNARGLLLNLTAQTSPPADCFDSRGFCIRNWRRAPHGLRGKRIVYGGRINAGVKPGIGKTERPPAVGGRARARNERFSQRFHPPPPPSNDRERERERERGGGVEHFGADFEGIIPPRAGSFSRNEPSLGEIGARARARAFSPSRGRRKGDREDRGKRARTQRERRD